jgi:hypothetical protein
MEIGNAKTTKAIKNDFNRLAEKLGCKARLAGNARNPKFQMWTGSISSDGYEIVVGIDSQTFAKLINNYPELH